MTVILWATIVENTNKSTKQLRASYRNNWEIAVCVVVFTLAQYRSRTAVSADEGILRDIGAWLRKGLGISRKHIISAFGIT